jgi:hypothetical protein
MHITIFCKAAQSSQRAIRVRYICYWTKRKYYRGFFYADPIVYSIYQSHDVRRSPVLRGADIGDKNVKGGRSFVCQELDEILGLKSRIIPGPEVVNETRKMVPYTRMRPTRKRTSRRRPYRAVWIVEWLKPHTSSCLLPPSRLRSHRDQFVQSVRAAGKPNSLGQ